MYDERIKKENVSEEEQEARMKKLNLHMNKKIQNVKRSLNKKQKAGNEDW